MKKEKDTCPLSLVDWLNYLTLEQNRERYEYYNEEVSFLSNMIIVLTIILGVFGFLSIFNTFDFFPSDYKVWFAVIAGIIFIVIICYSIYIGNYFKNHKKRLITIIDKEAGIIEDIIKGKEKDSQKILERYDSIWKNKRNIL
jgi:uncharacterized membrane protein